MMIYIAKTITIEQVRLSLIPTLPPLVSIRNVDLSGLLLAKAFTLELIRPSPFRIIPRYNMTLFL